MNESDLCAFGIPEFMPSDGGGLLKERYKSYPDRLRFQVAFVPSQTGQSAFGREAKDLASSSSLGM